MSGAAVRHVIDVTADLLMANDQARGGRLPLFVVCPSCGDFERRRIGMIGPGRWAIDHTHGGYWSAHLLRMEVPDVPRAGHAEARAFVDALAAVR